VPERLINTWQNSDDNFREAELEILALRDDKLRAGIDSWVDRDDKEMLKFAAGRLPEYRKEQTVRHQHSGAVGVFAMTPEEREHLIRTSNAAIEVEFERE
jgi:hypothetical protein